MSLSMFDLTDRAAIVTGGGRGLGRAIALGFAEAGADVVVCARSSAEIEDTAAKIRDKGRRALAVTADVRNVDQVTNILHETLAHFGTIDILVNNAGGGIGGSTDLLQMTFQDWESSVEMSLNSVFICSRIIGEQMVKQETGNIISMSSVAGMGPFPGAAHYGAAKAGIISFTKSLAVELAPRNVRVNAIAPGWIHTAGAENFYQQNPQLKQDQLEKTPLGRLGKPEDIVGVAIYLASDASAYVTGETIVVNGGLTTTVTG